MAKCFKILIAVAMVAAIFSLPGCYSHGKAINQFSRAAIAYPEIPAEYCARTYPPQDSIIKGDTLTRFDTIYTGGATSFDTTIVMDTKYITKTVQLPGTKIIEKYYIHDTLQVINTAEVDLWRIEARRAIGLLEKKTAEYDKMKKDRDKWRLIAIGLMVVLGLGLFFKVRKMFAKK